MADKDFTSRTITVNHLTLGGGLNSTSGPLNLQDNEASEIQNIDFDKFGSILKRGGYTTLSTSELFAGASTELCDALIWAEFTTGNSVTREAVTINGSKIYKMDSLDGTWDEVTGGVTITSGIPFDYQMYATKLIMTNGSDVPIRYTTGDTATAAGIPSGLTKAKYVEEFNNYVFYANVVVSGANYPTRIYWSTIRDPETWDSADWIEIARNDGQEITGLKVLSDRLVVYKEKSIYNVFFTGDVDIPFTLPGGGKSNSAVGCVAPFSIQEVENGHVFLSYDGLYYYDGMNSYRISDRVTTTILGLNTTRLAQARSLVHKSKSRYWLALPSSGQTKNNRVLVWDYFNNAFSVYVGVNCAALATFFIDGVQERPYFGDYDGFIYRADTGRDDYTLNIQTAIDAYFWSNWKTFDDLVNKKGIAQVAIYYQESSTVLTFAYSYDFESTPQHSATINLSGGTSVYGTAVYGTGIYSGAGGAVKRRDLIGRGRAVRFKFSNNTLNETFRIDGFGTAPHLETNA